MSAKLRASSLPSQAGLMRMRGDLRGTSARFRVQLDKPSPATIYSDPISRIGMEVKRHDSNARLVVNDVDENPRQRTPVAQWNTAEERQADRGDEEQHASHAIKPGDRIKAVNNHNSATLMLSELQEAAKPEEPRPVNLEVSRDISNVLAPSPPKPKTSASVPALIPEGGPSSMSRPPKPPRSPARGDRQRSVTESGWRASSRSKDLPSVQLPGMPIQWDAGMDLQLRSRNASPGPSLAAKRRAVSVGSFERQVTRSSSQGALSSAGFHALRS